VALLLWPGTTVADNADAAWRALAGDGAVALVRHAQAPSPDPPGFRIEECATERYLSAESRAQAARLGARKKGAQLGMLLSEGFRRVGTIPPP
jgi:hypothetical protein